MMGTKYKFVFSNPTLKLDFDEFVIKNYLNVDYPDGWTILEPILYYENPLKAGPKYVYQFDRYRGGVGNYICFEDNGELLDYYNNLLKFEFGT